MELTDKTAVITGGASGIGLATARQFASSGANLVLGDIEEAPLLAAVAALREDGAHVIGVRGDVSVEEDVVAMRDAALREFGAAHLIFNNAGVVGGPMIGTPKSVWDWVLDVNIGGVVNGINAFVPLFLEQDEGHVINTASLAGLLGTPYTGAYCASKFAVVGMSESLFHELADSGRHVNVAVLCPGFVKTRIFESGRNMPDELMSYNEDPALAQAASAGRDAVMAGIDASVVATEIENAVRENKFWILPHARAAIGSTKQRLEWMRGGPPATVSLAGATRP